jgi:hypothetical protein
MPQPGSVDCALPNVGSNWLPPNTAHVGAGQEAQTARRVPLGYTRAAEVLNPLHPSCIDATPTLRAKANNLLLLR